MAYCIYLRKSRADQEAEMQGAGDTLKRHEATLTAFAAARNLPVTRIYREIVSGDTISSRPQMQQLLADIEQGLWEGVLCMEIERLARGDTIDQGIVAQTFKYTGTRIITPQKTYNPKNEIDEEYFEFSLFMARREYNTIKRRMLAGTQASLREGNYLAPYAPFGYERERLPGRGSRWHLVIKPDEAAVVRKIYDLYVNGVDGKLLGCRNIAAVLNDMGLRTKNGNRFDYKSISQILTNPTYCGNICWGRRTRQVVIENGRRITVSKSSQPKIMRRNVHDAIIPQELFDEAQAILHSRIKPSSTPKDRTDQNPFRSLVYCSKCGHMMQRMVATHFHVYEYISCHTQSCPTASTRLEIFEDAVLQVLGQISALGDTISIDAAVEAAESANSDLIASLKSRREQLQRQRSRIQELLETNVYDVDTYLTRNADITQQLDAITRELDQANAAPCATGYTRKQISAVTSFLSEYDKSATPVDKQRMLSAIIDKIIYTRPRTQKQKKPANAENLQIEIHLKPL